MQLRAFTVNPFQENTYVLWDASGAAILVDPGMLHPEETQAVQSFLAAESLTLTHVVLTHAHLDHVFGCQWAFDTYGLTPWQHPDSLAVYRAAGQQAALFGLPEIPLPGNGGFLRTDEPLRFGETELELRLAPGHAPGHVVLIHHTSKQVVVGDVLFAGSIGRTDLPGGSYEVLMQSIFQQLLTLPDDYTVHPGHMGSTTIGRERRTNPFILQEAG